jgi:enoyl-CoA hydratase
MGEPTLEIEGHRATIRLQRPDKRNRLEPADLVRLMALCDQIDDERAVRVAVLASSGPSFCSGFHLGALAQGERPKVAFAEVCDRIQALRVPVLGRIAGNIHGGGTDLALACDIRIAAAGIHLVMPAGRIGVHYYATGLRRFVEQIGPAATKRIFLTALPFEADELLRLGYLDEVVAMDELDPRIDTVADAVAALAPLAVSGMKASINELAVDRAALAGVDTRARANFASNDHREAMTALGEKRPPRFTGT